MKRQFRFILHIGTEKTGTTTLQHQLYHNQRSLQELGLNYFTSPERVESRTLAAAAVGDKVADDYLLRKRINTPDERQAFRKEVERYFSASLESLPGSVHTVIISSEHFHSRLCQPEHLRWLKSLLAPYSREIQVIVYLRRQVDMAASYYSTELKNGGVRTLEQAVRHGCRPGNHYFNYQALLSLWSETFGEHNITPRLFSPAELLNGDITADFLHATDLSACMLSAVAEYKRYNESLTPFGQVLLRGLNASVKCARRLEPNGDIEEFALELRQQFAGSGERLDVELATEIQAAFDQSNATVCKQWFPEREFLFAPVKAAECRPPTIKLLNTEQQILVGKIIQYLTATECESVLILDPCANYLRDMALQVEANDLPLATRLMELASQIRPQDPFINRKLGEYRVQSARISQRIRQWLRRAIL